MMIWAQRDGMKVIHPATIAVNMMNIGRTINLQFVTANNAPQIHQSIKPVMLVHDGKVT
jgi:hypothetical protein